MKEALTIIFEILVKPVVDAINNLAAANGGQVGSTPAADNKAPEKAPRGRPKNETNPAPTASTAAVSKEDVRAAIRACVEKHNKGEDLEAMLTKKFKAPNGLKDLKESDYPAVIAGINKICGITDDQDETPAPKKDPWDD